MRTPAEYVADLDATVNDWYAARITYEEFGRRNAALWAEIQADRETDRYVLAILRGDRAEMPA